MHFLEKSAQKVVGFLEAALLRHDQKIDKSNMKIVKYFT